MTKRFLIVLLTALAALSFMGGIIAYAEEVKTVTWEQEGVTLTGTTDGTAVTITGCASELDHYDVAIPEAIDGLPVTAIAPAAFQNNCAITGVSIPAGVKSLTTMTFYGCSALARIDLNQVQSLGDEYNGWTTLGETWSLAEITVAEDNPALTVSDGILFTKDMTTLLLYPTVRPGKSYTIPETVTKLWPHAFNRVLELEEVTLSSGIEEYWDSFYRCKALKVLNLNMLARVGGDNFSRCTALEKVTIAPGNENLSTVDGVLFTADRKTLLFYPPAHAGESYEIPAGVEAIGDKAFMQCNLSQIFFPESLTEICGNAFAYSEKLEELIFPEGLTTIGTNACTGCESLTAVYVPASVTSIAYGSLDGPMMGPYAVIYGPMTGPDGQPTYASKYVSEHAEEYTFKDIEKEKMPRAITIRCPDELALDVNAAPYDLEAACTAELSYESEDTRVVTVDDRGVLTPLANGTAVVRIQAPADTFHDETLKEVRVIVGTGVYIEQKAQTITGKQKITRNYGCKAFFLGQKAKTALTYRSSNKKIANVTKAGKVKILRPGKVIITVTAAETDYYRKASRTVTIVAKVKAPTLKAKRSGRKVKLSWGKVPKAAGYQLYVKFPGARTYEKVLTEPAKVKSVTHRGLSKGKTYRYKLRAWVKVGGKKYYSDFSKVKTVKIK